MQNNEHGGNIYRFIEETNYKLEDIIDFSASINPLGLPEGVKKEIMESIKYLCYYPDSDSKRLKEEVARHLQIEPKYILCGNGSTELIYLTVRALKPKRILIPIPTFSEYERACNLNNGLHVVSYGLKKEKNFDLDPEDLISILTTHYPSQPFDMVFLCNPNNPTGRLIKKEDLLKIAEVAQDLRCYLFVDEAFIDFVPEESIAKEVINNPYLIVLRSMTKFYALSGLRIGYAVYHDSIINIIKAHKEPWTMNILAQRAGVAALKDIEYKEQTFKVIEIGKKNLEEGFRSLRINYLPTSTNFYLIRHKSAQEIIAFLKSKGIMIRDCSNFKGLDSTYMRVAIRSEEQNKKLLKELTEICQAL